MSLNVLKSDFWRTCGLPTPPPCMETLPVSTSLISQIPWPGPWGPPPPSLACHPAALTLTHPFLAPYSGKAMAPTCPHLLLPPFPSGHDWPLSSILRGTLYPPGVLCLSLPSYSHIFLPDSSRPQVLPTYQKPGMIPKPHALCSVVPCSFQAASLSSVPKCPGPLSSMTPCTHTVPFPTGYHFQLCVLSSFCPTEDDSRGLNPGKQAGLPGSRRVASPSLSS